MLWQTFHHFFHGTKSNVFTCSGFYDDVVTKRFDEENIIEINRYQLIIGFDQDSLLTISSVRVYSHNIIVCRFSVLQRLII